MTLGHMYDQFVGPWSQNTLATTGNYAMAFRTQLEGGAVKVGWYRGGVGAGYSINRLQLWRVQDQVLLWETTSPVDGGGVGWHWTTLSPNVGLTGGVLYCVAYNITAGKTQSYIGGASMPPYGDGLEKPLEFRRYALNSTGFPATADNAFGHPVDVEFDSTYEPSTGGGTAEEVDIENALVRWLASNGDNTRQDQLPWLTKVVVDTIASTQATHTGAIAAVAPTVMGSGGPTLATLAGNVATAVGLSALGAVVDNIVNNLLGNTGEDSVHEQLQAIAAQTSTNSRPEDQIAVGGTGWTLTDTQIGNGSIAHRVSADAYILTIDVVGAHVRQETLVDDVVIFYMRGFAWWLNGQAVGHRQELNALENVIRQPGTRYPGVLIDVPPDVGWTLTSWDYTG